MGNVRQARTVRKNGTGCARLRESDYWLLEALAKMRFLKTSQITKLFQKSRWTTNKWMRKLVDAGLVRVWVRSLAEENIYSLDRAGARMLQKSQEATDRRINRDDG